MNASKERFQADDTTRVIKRDNSSVAVVLKKTLVLPILTKVVDESHKEGLLTQNDDMVDWDKLGLKNPRLWLDKKLFSEALSDIIKGAAKKNKGEKPAVISMKYDGANDCTISITYHIKESEQRNMYGRSVNFSHRTAEIILQHGAKLEENESDNSVRIRIIF